MLSDIDEIKELREKFYSSKNISVSDDEIHKWYEILSDLIIPLKRRYRIFSICQNFKILLIFFSLTIFNSAILVLIDSFGFQRESTPYLLTSIIISGIFWIGVLLLYVYISEDNNYISHSVNKEIQRMREELYTLLLYQIKLTDEGLKRNIFLFRKHIEKDYRYYQKLFEKLSKAKSDLLEY